MRANFLSLLRSTTRCNCIRYLPRAMTHTECAIRWSSTSSRERQWSTPLAKSLAEAIKTTGPISVASYMRQCLTSQEGGYYTRQTETGNDQFGTKGDFITSPEISQVFGELVGLWLYTEWLAQGRKDRIQIIEVGPGRGTLMDDVLRTISRFKPFVESIEAVYLVEASPHLRKQQAKLLSGCDDLQETDQGWTSSCKYIPGRNVVWVEDTKFIPREDTPTPFILAHEFFDALPIHVFQNKPHSRIPASSRTLTPAGAIAPKHKPQTPQNQWHELVVIPTPPCANPTITTSTSPSSLLAKTTSPEFELTVSKTPTPHSLYLPQVSSRYRKLQNTPEAVIEISPEALSYISDFAARIGGSNPPTTKTSPPYPNPNSYTEKSQPSGAALILDYGPRSTIPANTLRGIRAHRTCSPFISPGLVDLSADVDFLALAESALNASPGVEVHGPVEQSFFLSTMGIKERAERLLKNAKNEETEKRLETGWKRLVDRGPTGMGRIYKAMAIVPYKEGEIRRPVGFGGGVVG